MKRQWQICRSVVEQSDGQRRWDLAYQLLLVWAMESNNNLLQVENPSLENDHENSSVYPSIDKVPNAKPDH